jgi:hypothetical protein
MPLVYALVARRAGAGGGGPAAPLAQHAAAGPAAGLEAVAMECYASYGSTSSANPTPGAGPGAPQSKPREEQFSVMCDGWMFNFLERPGFVFLVVADEATGRPLPFFCARRLADAFDAGGFAARAYGAKPRGLQRALGCAPRGARVGGPAGGPASGSPGPRPCPGSPHAQGRAPRPPRLTCAPSCASPPPPPAPPTPNP